jgi:hypothetical protein
LPAVAPHKGQGRDFARLHELAGLGRLFLRSLQLPALPALQDGLANVGTDLCFESVKGLGKLAGSFSFWT